MLFTSALYSRISYAFFPTACSASSKLSFIAASSCLLTSNFKLPFCDAIHFRSDIMCRARHSLS